VAPFVGDNFYCDVGDIGPSRELFEHSSVVGSCVDDVDVGPDFEHRFAQVQHAALEARLCADEPDANEELLLTDLNLWTCASVYSAQQSIRGCTDNRYAEFDPAANVNDGSCETTAVAICVDPLADNYQPTSANGQSVCDYACARVYGEVFQSQGNPDICAMNDVQSVITFLDSNHVASFATAVLTVDSNFDSGSRTPVLVVRLGQRVAVTGDPSRPSFTVRTVARGGETYFRQLLFDQLTSRYTGMSAFDSGMVLRHVDGTVTFSMCIVSGNAAWTGGGAIWMSGGISNIISTRFVNNVALIDSDGGAILITGGVMRLSAVEFLSNTAGGSGGAIHVAGGAVVINATEACSFTSNVAGEILTSPSSARRLQQTHSDPQRRRLQAQPNSVVRSGGGISLNAAATVSLIGGTIASNQAFDSGGGICSSGGAAVTVSRLLLSSNSASRGGAIAADTGSLIVFETNIVQNSANAFEGHNGLGGAMHLAGNTIVSVSDSIIGQNLASMWIADSENIVPTPADGGALYVANARINIQRSAFIENQATAGGFGGVVAMADGRLTVESTSLLRNTAVRGEFAYLSGHTSESEPLIRNCSYEASSNSSVSFFGAIPADCSSEPCSSGQGCEFSGFSLFCSKCPDGTYSADGVACTTCDPGSGPMADETDSQGSTHCVPCEEGLYSSEGVCRTCPPGKQPSEEQTACDACVGETFSSAGLACISCVEFAVPLQDGTQCECMAGVHFQNHLHHAPLVVREHPET
jgi:predicted outer membrane repeat protein